MNRLAIVGLALISPAFAQTDFPDGPAKEYVTKICLQCHEPSMLLSQRKSESDWKLTVSRMALRRVFRARRNSTTRSRHTWPKISRRRKTRRRST